METAQEQGYFVTVVYLWLSSPDIAVARVRARVEAGGHDVPAEVIRRRYYAGLEYFFNIYAPACDKWMLVDNSKNDFQIVAEGTRKRTTVRNRKLYQQIKAPYDSP